jgi:hypothetical protein
VSDNRSLIYAHPSLYQLLMRVIYAGGYAARYQALSQLIPDGADVFEACAGDAYLYRHYLQPRGIRYRAGEFNETFVTHARARGIEMQRFDLRKDPVPQADVVLIHASLYQFMPDHQQIIDRLLAAARQQLIVSEPVRNLSSSRWALIRWIASRSAATRPASISSCRPTTPIACVSACSSPAVVSSSIVWKGALAERPARIRRATLKGPGPTRRPGLDSGSYFHQAAVRGKGHRGYPTKL